MIRSLAFALVWAWPAQLDAQSLMATRTIRAQEIIQPGDLVAANGDSGTAAAFVGMEARVMLYPGREVRPDQLGAPALVERNALVSIIYESGGLRIVADGRSLARAAVGEAVQALNLASRKTVVGVVASDGSIIVGGLTK